MEESWTTDDSSYSSIASTSLSKSNVIVGTSETWWLTEGLNADEDDDAGDALNLISAGAASRGGGQPVDAFRFLLTFFTPAADSAARPTGLDYLPFSIFTQILRYHLAPALRVNMSALAARALAHQFSVDARDAGDVDAAAFAAAAAWPEDLPVAACVARARAAAASMASISPSAFGERLAKGAAAASERALGAAAAGEIVTARAVVWVLNAMGLGGGGGGAADN